MIDLKSRFSNWLVLAGYMALAVAIYFPALEYDYVLDDKIVFTENQYVQQGWHGIPKILKGDSFEGYFGGQEDLLPGARYRPLSLVTFAVEHAIFGQNRSISHGINILLYLLCSWLLFIAIRELLDDHFQEYSGLIALASSLIFLIHPVHVEAVANVKGRDEIMALFLSVSTLLLALRYIRTSGLGYLLSLVPIYLLALLSKENSLTFLAVIPASLWLLCNRSKDNDFLKRGIAIIGVLLVTSVIYFLIRYAAVGYIIGDIEVTNIMNNPFVHMSIGEKYATIFYTLLEYLRLLVFPHPLTHDYYPFHVPTMQWSQVLPIVSLLIHIIMGLMAIFFLFKKDRYFRLFSWCFIFYLSTLSIVSNVFVGVGTFMNERFLFMPSVSFCVLIGAGLVWLYKSSFKWKKYTGLGLMSILLIAFTAKSATRLPAWGSAFSLNTAAVKVSKNSIRANLFLGTAYYQMFQNESDLSQKDKYLNEAQKYVNKSFELYPKYKNASYMKAGIAAEIFKRDGNVPLLLNTFTNIARSAPETSFIHEYLQYMNGVSSYHDDLMRFYYNVGFKEMYSNQKRFEWAARYLLYAIEIDENDPETNFALSKIYNALNRPQETQYYLQKAQTYSNGQ